MNKCPLCGGLRSVTINQLEAEAIQKALVDNNYSLTETAKALGVGRATIYRKIKQYNLTMAPFETP